MNYKRYIPFLIVLTLAALTIFGAKYVTQDRTGAMPVLTVPQGGTGASTFASGECLKGAGTGAITTGACATGGSGVGTVSTSTSPTIGNLSYWTSKDAWPETLGSVATTTLTATSPLALSQPINVLGGSASVLTVDVTGDWTGTIDGNNFLGGAIGQGELIYGSAAGVFSELAAGTSGYILESDGTSAPKWVATTTIPLFGDVTGTLSVSVVGDNSHDHDATTISGLGTADISGLDISADTNLTAGDALTLTDDDIDFDGGASPGGALGGTWASPTIDSDGTWTGHNDYPAACAAGNYVQAIGDTLTCAADTTGTGGAGTVSTSTSPTVSNLAYWTSKDAWPETLGSVATTTLTATAPLVLSQAIRVIGASASVLTCSAASASAAGCLSTADWTSFTNKVSSSSIDTFAELDALVADADLAQLTSAMTGTFDGVDFGNGTLAQNALWVGGAAAIPSELGIGTASYVLAVANGTPTWVATTSMPVSGDVTGTLTTLTIAADAVHDSMIDWGTGANQVSIADLSGGQVSGAIAWDLGGASSFELPQDGTIDATGEIKFNTTSSTIEVFDGTAIKSFVPFHSKSFMVSSSTWGTGTTTTFSMGAFLQTATVHGGYCSSSPGTLGVQIFNGATGAVTGYLVASSTNYYITFAANEYALSQPMNFKIGGAASSPTLIECSFKYYYDTD